MKLLLHAEKTVKNLMAVTARAKDGYSDALELARKSLDNLQQHENVLDQAKVSLAYFQITLEDEALDRGADTLWVDPPSKNGGLRSDTKVLYRSSMTPLFHSPRFPLTMIL